MASSTLYLVLLLLFVVLGGSTATTSTAETFPSSNITSTSPLMAAKIMKDKVATTTLGVDDICVPGLTKALCCPFRCPCCMVGEKNSNKSTITANPVVKDVVTMLGNVTDQVCRPGLSKAMCCSFRCPCCTSVTETTAYRNMTSRTTVALPSMDGGKDIAAVPAICDSGMPSSMCCTLRCPCCTSVTERAAYRNMTNRTTTVLPSMDGSKDVAVVPAICNPGMPKSMCCTFRCPCCREEKH